MLVLSRKLNESIIAEVGDVTLAFTVQRIAGGKVRIGIEAPPEVIVHRKEVALRIAAELKKDEVAA